MSAVSLEAKIAAGSVLEVEKATIGRLVGTDEQVAENQVRGQCDGATHVISGVDLGAFTFEVVKKAEASGSVDVKVVQAGGSKSSEHEVLSSDGDLAACEAAEPAPGPIPILSRASIAESTPARDLLPLLEHEQVVEGSVCSPYGGIPSASRVIS